MMAQPRFWRRTGMQASHALAAAAVFLLSSVAVCYGDELNSLWRDRAITVDGLDTEWDGTRVYLKNANASVGILNDSDYVYVSFVTIKEQTIRQVSGMGLILWFDAEGGKDKKFGIRFPLGMMESGMVPPRDFNEARSDADRAAERAERFKKATLELEILGPGDDDVRRVQVSTLEGIEAKANITDNMLVYELKVPIVKSDLHPFAIGAEPGERIGVGIATPKMDRDAMKERRGGGMRGGGPPGGGMPGGMPPGAGRGGGRPGGGGFERPNPLKVWAKVQLAAPAQAETDSGNKAPTK